MITTPLSLWIWVSYTTFAYENLSVSHEVGGWPIEVTFTLTNTGPFAGDKVVQLYISDLCA